MTEEQNRRRYELILKEHRVGLTALEALELADLQEIASAHADRVAPLPTEDDTWWKRTEWVRKGLF